MMVRGRCAEGLVAFLLTGCGSQGKAGDPAPVATEGLIVVEMHDGMAFAPEVVTAVVGDTIVWVNRGDLPHTTTARAEFAPLEKLPSAADSWDSGLMDGGEEYRIVVRAIGEYRYVCSIHQAAGMVGRFRVE